MMEPERKTAKALAQTETLSGTAPATSILHKRSDQVMSHQALEPIWVAQHFVSHGHDLEIPMALWGRDSRLGHELRLARLDPDGCVVRNRSATNRKGLGLDSSRRVETVAPAQTRGGFSSCAQCVYLTGAFLWVRLCALALDFGCLGLCHRER
jgi:hypothetical protein